MVNDEYNPLGVVRELARRIEGEIPENQIVRRCFLVDFSDVDTYIENRKRFQQESAESDGKRIMGYAA